MESPMEMSCPVCGDEKSLKMITHSTQIAYFGEHTQITLTCSNCGLRQTDFIPAEGKIPGVWTLKLDSLDSLNARVVRGSKCTIEIPELELGVYPGVHSSGYVSNVEGVLNRFKDAINITKNQFEKDELNELEKCDFLLDTLNKTISGSNMEIITLIFSDPMGHSKILHDKAIFRELTPEEIENLS
ncbi:MAG: hypothetical protein CMA27_03160 [Euryarchaeota archaeon]|nr:hypothetical protein [Euryarchaeota archaeon]